jgi:hypothetical protein
MATGKPRLTVTVIRSPIADRRQGVGVIPADGVFFQKIERRSLDGADDRRGL